MKSSRRHVFSLQLLVEGPVLNDPATFYLKTNLAKKNLTVLISVSAKQDTFVGSSKLKMETSVIKLLHVLFGLRKECSRSGSVTAGLRR